MLRANYTEQEKETFQKLRYDYPDRRIMERFEVLWLHACGKFASEIATLTGIHANTVRKHITNYAKGGIKLVTTIDSNHPTSELDKHRVSLIEEFKKNPPADAKEAAARIKKLTGIERSEQRVRKFMERLGMKYRKVGAVPAKADLEKQETFKKKYWSQK
jgi:hypothetical protein